MLQQLLRKCCMFYRNNICTALIIDLFRATSAHHSLTPACHAGLTNKDAKKNEPGLCKAEPHAALCELGAILGILIAGTKS